MNLRRIVRHLLAPDWLARRALSKAALARIGEAVRDSERSYAGELRFAVEAGLPLAALLRDTSPRTRAEEVFAQLRVWDTEHNSGVLVYVQLIDHRIEIVADRGISAKVAQAEWDAVCRNLESAYRTRRYEEGSLEAMAAITRLLVRHFPAQDPRAGETAGRPAIR